MNNFRRLVISDIHQTFKISQYCGIRSEAIQPVKLDFAQMSKAANVR